MIYRNQKFYLAIIFAVVLILLPTHQVNAYLFGLDDIAYGAVLKIFAYAAYIIFTIAGNFISLLAKGLYIVINMPVYPTGGSSLAVVDESWKIMRNFANMFFIVALIMMAFATIFDVLPGAAKYNARALFGRFLLTALLINFSLVLGVMVIQGTQVLSNTFLTAIGDMSGRLGQGLNPSSLLPGASSDTFQEALTSGASGVDSTVFGALVQIIFSLVLVMTFVFSLLTAFIFAIVRIPILWALLIVSPIAWILNVFPAGEGMFKKWWSTFIGWNMFLPIFLFFLYFGLYFLQSQTAIMAAIANQTKDQALGTGIPDFFQRLFFYVLASIFLIGGTMVAMKASMFSGTGVVQVAGWARKTALRTTGIAGWQRGGQEKWKEMQTEGYGVGQYRFGGEKAFEREAGRRARMLGTKGALEKGVDAEKEKQKPYANDLIKLRELAKGGTKEQMLAARARLTELGDKDSLTSERVNQTYQMYGGDRSEAANKYISSIDFAKLTDTARMNLSKSMTNIEARKKNALVMIEKDKLDVAEITRLAGQFTNTAEVREFLDKGSKKNLINAAKARVSLALEGVGTIDDEIEKAFKKITDDQIIEMVGDTSFNSSTVEGQKIEEEMKKIFNKNPKRLETIIAKAPAGVRTNLDNITTIVRQTQVEPLKIKRIAAETKANQARLELANIQTDISNENAKFIPNDPNPNSDYQKNIRKEIDRLNGEFKTKESEIKTEEEKIDKYDERIKSIESGTPLTTP